MNSKKIQTIFRDEYKSFISEYLGRKGVGRIIEETFDTLEITNNEFKDIFEIKVKLLDNDVIEILMYGNEFSFRVTSNDKELYHRNYLNKNELEIVTKNTKSRIDFINYFDNIDKIINKNRNRFDFL